MSKKKKRNKPVKDNDIMRSADSIHPSLRGWLIVAGLEEAIAACADSRRERAAEKKEKRNAKD